MWIFVLCVGDRSGTVRWEWPRLIFVEVGGEVVEGWVGERDGGIYYLLEI